MLIDWVFGFDQLTVVCKVVIKSSVHFHFDADGKLVASDKQIEKVAFCGLAFGSDGHRFPITGSLLFFVFAQRIEKGAQKEILEPVAFVGIEKEGKDVAPDGLAAGKSSDLEERRPAFNDGEILEAIEQILKVSVHALAPSLALTTSMKFLICCQCASTISSRFVGLHRSNVRRPTVISENFSKLIAGIKSVKYAHH